MKRSSEDEQSDSSPDEKMEALLGGFLAQYPRLPWVIGVIIAALVIIGLVLVFK
jgi:hypothetical protein